MHVILIFNTNTKVSAKSRVSYVYVDLMLVGDNVSKRKKKEKTMKEFLM